MKQLFAALASLALVVLTSLACAPAASASATGLQINPLKYEDTMSGPGIRSGHVDVSNPGDTTVAVATEVKGFRQADTDGNLAFFADQPLSDAIKPALSQFTLGPREAVRVAFSVDPAKLPPGGIYAAIFFRTVAPGGSGGPTHLAESANVGTLLLLQNGAGSSSGRVASFNLPFWQFGRGLSGWASYQNANHSGDPVAFSPNLQTRVFPWGRPARLNGPYVLPGSTRRFEMSRPGSFLGLLPITLTDQASGQGPTRWVFACTGLYAYGLLIMLAAPFVYWVTRRRPLKLGRISLRHIQKIRDICQSPLSNIDRKFEKSHCKLENSASIMLH